MLYNQFSKKIPNMKKQKVTFSKNQLRRLPIYLVFLKKCEAAGIKYINAQIVSDSLGFNKEQVRKDIAVMSTVGGIPNRGRDVSQLIRDIEKKLCINTYKSIIVGCGSLGRALLNYKNEEGMGLDIVAGFDTNDDLINTKVNKIPIYDYHRMVGMLPELGAQIGIICVPSSVAQSVVDELIANGIRAIWNFAPTYIRVPKGIVLSNVNMAASLAEVSHKLSLLDK
jgi:redox-sensing transcriptional repressor